MHCVERWLRIIAHNCYVIYAHAMVAFYCICTYMGAARKFACTYIFVIVCLTVADVKKSIYRK